MHAKVIAVASALVATAALASAAEAGGGVRLGFGGPLGTFVATPSHGGAYHAPRARKKAPVAQAARKPAKAQRVVKADPRPAPKAAAEKPETTENSTSAPVTGSSALIQGSIPAQEEGSAEPSEQGVSETKVEAPSDGATVKAEAPADQDSGNCTKFVPQLGTTVSVGCEK